MLAPLAVYLSIMLITCALALLICWAYDNDAAEIAAGSSRSAVLEFPVHPHKKRFPPFNATLAHPPGGRARSVVNQRGAAQSLSSKRNSRRLRIVGIIRSPRRFDNAASEESYAEGE